MESVMFSLSADEVAMSFLLVGREEAAKRYIASVLGKINPDEVKGRLLAAFDSLMARGLADWSEEKQKVVLEDNLESLVETSASPNVSVVATVIKEEGVENMAFHFGSRASAEVKNRGLLGQELRALEGPEAACASVEELMDWPEAMEGKRYTVSMTPEQLDNINRLSAQDKNALEGYLTSIGLEAETSKALSYDLINAESRGTVLRLDIDGDVAKVGQGFLTLKSPERCWILTPIENGGNPLVKGMVAGKEELRNKLAELIG